MIEFEKWKSKNCDDKGCPHEASCNCCEYIWRAALKWIKRELHAARDGFEPDLGLHNLIEKELNAKT